MDWNKAGGAAFPLKEPMTDDELGMTLRDYFAAKALQGILACQWPLSDIGYTMKSGKSALQNNALAAYEIADAMLEARSAA